LFRLRLFDAFLGLLTLGIAYLTAREVFAGASQVVPAVPLAIVGIPMFTAVSAGLSADPLANLFSAGVLLLLVRRVQGGVRAGMWWAVATGALIGLGVLTKLAVAILVPVALVVVVTRSVRPIREAALMTVMTALITVPWLVHQVTTYGWSDPLALSRHSAVVADQPRFPGLTPEYLTEAATITFHSFWAQFGWMAIVAQPRLYILWGVLTAVAVVGLATTRRGMAQPVWRLMLGTVGVALVGYIAYNLAFEQFQGRYLFTAVVAIAVLLVAGWAAWLPERFRPVSVFVVALALVAVNAYTLLRVLVLGFAPPQ
jgi:4-amino-4-deoxy-L-arabinose transferase-like glycosyltransferase